MTYGPPCDGLLTQAANDHWKAAYDQCQAAYDQLKAAYQRAFWSLFAIPANRVEAWR